MDTRTGHLVNRELLDSLFPEKQKEYTEVPLELERAAAMKLRGRKEASVSLTSGGKLSRWAAEVRAEKSRAASEQRRRGQLKAKRKQASRRRMAKASRCGNRG